MQRAEKIVRLRMCLIPTFEIMCAGAGCPVTAMSEAESDGAAAREFEAKGWMPHRRLPGSAFCPGCVEQLRTLLPAQAETHGDQGGDGSKVP